MKTTTLLLATIAAVTASSVSIPAVAVATDNLQASTVLSSFWNRLSGIRGNLRIAPAAPAARKTPAIISPTIASVKGRTVKVRVPTGFRSVVLERRTARKGHPWAVVETYLCDGGACTVTFKLGSPLPRRNLRVVGQRQTSLPPSFMAGLSKFQAGGTTSAAGSKSPAESVASAGTASNSALPLANASTAGADSVARTVTESDIWKLSGDRLYFFNQYRGLQVLEVSDPNHPDFLGQLRLPAQGDQLYELPGGYVALLTRKWGFNGDNGEIVICDVRAGQPAEVARLPYAGSLRESRLVGTALYVAVDRYTPSTVNSWQQQTVVIGFDLGDPANPVQRNEATIVPEAGGYWSYAAAVWANERHFLVASNDYVGDGYSSTVSIVDISDPRGTVKLLGAVTVDGQVSDKFKLSENGDTLSVISHNQRWGYDEGGWFNTQNTVLANFHIADPARIEPLGTLIVGEGERTYGTRFDGDRIYIVTAVQQDPLWIIDNSDPANPTLTSHLEVPGFSTYLEPLGDRLVTVGRLTGLDESGVWQNRTTVSLYDVADAASPRLLSQLPVGGDWSSSEANWNEKAFTVLPGDGLIMLPFSDSWGWWGGSGGGAIQLVDLQRDSLVLRGVIRHGFTPRRSTVEHNTVLALSARDLLSVDIADRDHPVVKSDLELAWTVNRVWNSGKYIVQLDKGRAGQWWWSEGSPAASLTISPADSPDDVAATLDLGTAPVLAAEVRDDLLYVAQGSDSAIDQTESDAGQASLTIYDLASLPKVIKRGTATVTGVEAIESSSACQILWPTRETLVLAARGSPWWHGSPVPLGAAGIAAAVADTMPFWGYGGSTARLFAFNAAAPATPKFLNETQLGKDSPANYSEAFAEDGRVFISRYRSGYSYYRSVGILASGETISPDADAGRYMLEVVDYSHPGVPVAAAPVSLPGELQGISRRGQLLYTTGPAYDAGGAPDYSRQVLHASAYDGTAAHLVDAIALAGYGGDIRLFGETLYVGQNDHTWQTDGTNQDHSRIEAWSLFDNGEFVLLGEHAIPAWAPWVLYANVLAWLDQQNLAAAEIRLNGEFIDLGSFPLDGTPLYDLAGGDGDLTRGLWLPAGDYGVEHVRLGK